VLWTWGLGAPEEVSSRTFPPGVWKGAIEVTASQTRSTTTAQTWCAKGVSAESLLILALVADSRVWPRLCFMSSIDGGGTRPCRTKSAAIMKLWIPAKRKHSASAELYRAGQFYPV